MVTDNQVAKQTEKNESLRKRIADLNAQREKDETAQINATKLARLKAEEAALKQELEHAERLAKVASKRAETAEPETVVPVGTHMTTPVETGGDEKKEK